MVLPFQLYGSWLVQMVVLVVSLITLFTVSIKLTIESQPLVLLRVSLYVPAALIVLPFHVYGNWLVQMVVLFVILSYTVYSQTQCDNRITTPCWW